MIKWTACLGQQLVPGLGTLDQQNLLPRNPRQRSRLIVINKQNTQSLHHSIKHHNTQTGILWAASESLESQHLDLTFLNSYYSYY